MARAVQYVSVRRGARSVWPFVLALPILALGVALPLLTGEPHLAFAGGGFLLFFLVFFVFRVAAVFYRYGFATVESGIVLQNMHRFLRIPAREIRRVSVLNEEGAREFLTRAYQPQIEIERAHDFTDWLAAARVVGYATEFLSVPVANSVTSRGNRRNISNWHVRWFGPAVQIDRHRGVSLLISPRDVDGFTRTAERLGLAASRVVLSEPTVETNLTPAATDKHLSTRGRWRPISLLSMVVLLLLVAGFVVPYVARESPRFSRDMLGVGAAETRKSADGKQKVPRLGPVSLPEPHAEWAGRGRLRISLPTALIPAGTDYAQPDERFFTQFIAPAVFGRCVELGECAGALDPARQSMLGPLLASFGMLALEDAGKGADGGTIVSYGYYNGYMLDLARREREVADDPPEPLP